MCTEVGWGRTYIQHTEVGWGRTHIYRGRLGENTHMYTEVGWGRTYIQHTEVGWGRTYSTAYRGRTASSAPKKASAAFSLSPASPPIRPSATVRPLAVQRSTVLIHSTTVIQPLSSSAQTLVVKWGDHSPSQ
eukprot:COSAG02_NODE_469_length_21727_cov_64.506334_8_plen_132_part_00